MNDDRRLDLLRSTLRLLYDHGTSIQPGVIRKKDLINRISTIEIEQEMVQAYFQLLRAMGLVSKESQNIRILGRSARFVIGSLLKFIDSDASVVNWPIVSRLEAQFLKSFAASLESIRVERQGVDSSPLHIRRIVNVIIMSKQPRNWWTRDVYLHMYHPEWNEYHLLGQAHDDRFESDDEVATAVMHEVLRFEDSFFQFEDYSIPDIHLEIVSKSSGALTDFQFNVKIVRKLSKELRVGRILEENPDCDHRTFRWFTANEMKNGFGPRNEVIMKSTQHIMNKIEQGDLRIRTVVRSAPYSSGGSVFNEVGNRISLDKILIGLPFLIITALVWFCVKDLPSDLSILGLNNEEIGFIASVIQIVSSILAMITFLRGFQIIK